MAIRPSDHECTPPGFPCAACEGMNADRRGTPVTDADNEPNTGLPRCPDHGCVLVSERSTDGPYWYCPLCSSDL